jgi:uncharacterized cofD-like protein
MPPSPQGPSVVAIGGGAGLSVTLRAVRRYAANTTAVVATADDSGSTGRLRSAMPMPALGDVRRCLAAIAGQHDAPIGRAMEHRFPGTDVEGHTLGNLLLVSLAAVTGDFLTAIDEAVRLLGVDLRAARVVPATVETVGLRATTRCGRVVDGQYAISQTAGLSRVALEPAGARAPRGLVPLIHEAHQIVLGPGSVYTSILAAALVDDIRTAVATAPGQRVYVCNLEPEHRETEGYDVAAHVDALRRHGVVPDVVLVDRDCRIPLGDVAIPVARADLAERGAPVHDSSKLATALSALLR